MKHRIYSIAKTRYWRADSKEAQNLELDSMYERVSGAKRVSSEAREQERNACVKIRQVAT